MSSEKKRAYISETRKEQAAETKKRILASAKKLFEKEGFEGVTIEKLAKAARVSGPTVYALFQSKRGVLRALMDEALPQDQRLALVEEGKVRKSLQECLAVTAKLSRQMYDAERSQMDIFRGAAVLSPEFKELEHEREERRYSRQEEFMRTMVADSSFPKGLSLSKARDILWAFTGRDLYRMLVVEKGWSSDAYEKWLYELLIKTLLQPC